MDGEKEVRQEGKTRVRLRTGGRICLKYHTVPYPYGSVEAVYSIACCASQYTDPPRRECILKGHSGCGGSRVRTDRVGAQLEEAYRTACSNGIK
jgi:hypothetical protein